MNWEWFDLDRYHLPVILNAMKPIGPSILFLAALAGLVSIPLLIGPAVSQDEPSDFKETMKRQRELAAAEQQKRSAPRATALQFVKSFDGRTARCEEGGDLSKISYRITKVSMSAATNLLNISFVTLRCAYVNDDYVFVPAKVSEKHEVNFLGQPFTSWIEQPEMVISDDKYNEAARASFSGKKDGEMLSFALDSTALAQPALQVFLRGIPYTQVPGGKPEGQGLKAWGTFSFALPVPEK